MAQGLVSSQLTRDALWGGFLLGFALGGFFDGVLLHQILRWHHLLSLVEGVGDLAAQVMWDGLFHLAMYVLALVGLAALWRARSALEAAGGRVVTWAILGFGVWHVADIVLFHWLLGLHRVRVDAPRPLLWDLGWLLVFGGGAVLVGLWRLRRDGGGGRAGPAGLAVVALAAGGAAAMPPAGDGAALAVFRPGAGLAVAAEAAAAVGGRVVWTDAAERVWAIELGPEANPLRLYSEGALFVSAGPIAAGCLSWTRLQRPPATSRIAPVT